MKNGHVTIDGARMDYVRFGRGGRKLVVLPGLSDGLATVKGKALLLSPPFRRFFRDYTVWMFSRKNDMSEGYTIEAMADDQALAMGKLGIDRACVLGVSQGGMIAQCLAIRHPELVEKLILAVTAPRANEVARAAVSGWIDMALRGDHGALMADTAERMYSEAYLRKHGKLLALAARFTKPASYDRFLKNARAILAFDARNGLSGISCPTLIVAGSEDHTVGGGAGSEVHRGVAGSELFVYDGLGHGAFEEAKDFYDRILAFCGR